MTDWSWAANAALICLGFLFIWAAVVTVVLNKQMDRDDERVQKGNVK